VKHAGERAASVTQQLLAFSRNQVLRPRVLNLNALLNNLGDFLQRLIGEDVALRMALDTALGSINADATQVEQVIMNLAVNARDAMPEGGELIIETRNIDMDEKSAHVRSLKVGSYILLSVRDTGCGMDAHTKAHIFEPFFTTKEQGKGTGLGLPMVYGIVEQSKGCVEVQSEVGQGSTFTVYLPCADGVQTEDAQNPTGMVSVPAIGTILLIEDDSAIRGLAQEVLVEAGYTVFEAGTGVEAIRIAQKLGRRLNLIISDVVMPGMSGPETVKHVMDFAGTPPVLYTSGYTDHSLIKRAALNECPNRRFMQKPFLPDSLLQTVTDMLSGSSVQ
jgi:CheY-like chemotaxis protein